VCCSEHDGELSARTEPLDELLLWLAEWAEEPDAVPAALHRPASEDVGDVRGGLNLAPDRWLYGPDGRYEHQPLAVVEQPAPTLEELGAALESSAGRCTPARQSVGVLITADRRWL
jgi:hypothetical protein